MALQAKSTLPQPIAADSQATTPTGDMPRRGSLAEPATPTFSTSTSDNENGSPAAHQTDFQTSPGGSRSRIRRTASGRRESELQTKEARRRKLLKVQAFLGERVPLEALSEQAGPSKSPTSPKTRKDGSKRSKKLLSRAGSTLMSNKLAKVRSGPPGLSSKGSLSADDGDKPAFPSLRSGSERASRSRLAHVGFGSEGDEPLSADHREWTFIQVDPAVAKSACADSESAADKPEKGIDPAMNAIRRARKLEKVFGSLPPAQMYTSRRPTYQPMSPRKLIARDDRPLPRSASGGNGSLKSKSSTSSLYRQSLASLRYIAHSGDPELIDGLARLVLAEEDESTDSEMETAGPKTPRKADNANEVADEDDERQSILGDVSGTDEDEQLVQIVTDKAGEGSEAPARSSIDTITSAKGTFGQPRTGVQSHVRTGSALSTFSAFGTSPNAHPRNAFTASFYGPGSSTAAGALYPSRRFGRESAMSGMTAHSSADSAYAFDEAGPHEGSPRSSMESVRIQFRRAHKLAKVFGTTRGEVFNKVLDDIEADMNEDEELDEEERRDVLGNVAALRASL